MGVRHQAHYSAQRLGLRTIALGLHDAGGALGVVQLGGQHVEYLAIRCGSSAPDQVAEVGDVHLYGHVRASGARGGGGGGGREAPNKINIMAKALIDQRSPKPGTSRVVVVQRQ